MKSRWAQPSGRSDYLLPSVTSELLETYGSPL